MGDKQGKKTFHYKLALKTKESLQIRDNALESARQSCNRLLEKRLGKGEFYFFIRTYPHHFLRMNALASGAGADRLSTGMKHAFGKVVGRASQLRANQTIFELSVKKKDLATAKTAFKRASFKLPCPCAVTIEEIAN
jgi:large subunit ribosomal protein L10e